MHLVFSVSDKGGALLFLPCSHKNGVVHMELQTVHQELNKGCHYKRGLLTERICRGSTLLDKFCCTFRRKITRKLQQKRQKHCVSASKGSTPTPWARERKTKSKNGRSRSRKPFISRVFCAQRGIETMVSEWARPWGRGESGDCEFCGTRNEFQRIAKGAGGKGPRQKTSKSVKKFFFTLFDNFRAGQKTSKIVKKCQKYFRHFSTIFARHQFSGPFWGALEVDLWPVARLTLSMHFGSYDRFDALCPPWGCLWHGAT